MNENTKKSGGALKVIIGFLLALLVVGGIVVGVYLFRQGGNYLTTDNARVTTDLVHIAPTSMGIWEGYDINTGSHISTSNALGVVRSEGVEEVLRAPIDGLVVHSLAIDGQMIFPGEPVAVIADTNNIRIEAFIEETDINRLRLGQNVTVTIDALDNREFRGHISSIGQITFAELTGQAIFFNTAGNFTRVTQLFPIEVTLSDNSGNLYNFIGGNARVRIPLR